MISPGDTCGTSSQFVQQMAAINESKSSFQRELASFKEEIKKGQDESAERIAKRARREQSFDFTKKGNKHQYNFNERVAGIFEDAMSLLLSSSGPPSEPTTATPGATSRSSAKLKELLEEGIKIIEERQKLIKLAERFEYGWGLVSEYQADELAVDSADEKRIQKAEKAAEKKRRKRKGRRQVPRAGSGVLRSEQSPQYKLYRQNR